jgi:hypothetical protein
VKVSGTILTLAGGPSDNLSLDIVPYLQDPPTPTLTPSDTPTT